MSFSFTRWLKNCKTNFIGRRRKQPRQAARTIRTVRLNIELLEDRLTPSTITPLASFGSNGAYPEAPLVRDSSGNLFGTTKEGGAQNNGTVFEIAAGSGAITTLASFDGTNGANPVSSLVLDSSGNLFGTTYLGGASNKGTVFEVAADSDTITTLASFNRTNGERPVSSLVLDSSGNLFGTTSYGGTLNFGTVFEIAAGSGTITTLASFGDTNGAFPSASLVLDSSGNLFGTTQNGGTSSYGTVFEIAAGSGTITTLASFNATNGAFPLASLVLDSSGNLFGTTSGGGAGVWTGTVFEVTAGSGTITTLASFNGTNGANPVSSLVLDSSGNLFGTTNLGGASNKGTVFELAAGSGAITTLASFNVTNGTTPYSSLVLDSSGNLFGITARGGASDYGTAFEVVAGSGTITTLASFNGPVGTNVSAGLVLDSSGNLFGNTGGGGESGKGTVYEMAAGSGVITILASFDGTNGERPVSSLVLDSSGNLFGTTYLGGASNKGTVFEVAADSDTITTLASFNGTNGANPVGSLVMDGSGNLFGTTFAGGLGFGTVFEVAAGSGTITTLASFNGTNGANVYAGLVRDGSGNLFGTTYLGGASNVGTVFEVAAGSGAITTLASFNGTNGANPFVALVMDSSGNLFGTTTAGGASNLGTVFEVAAGSGTITTLASFNVTNGTTPYSSLVLDSSGDLFGTASAGGASNKGTVFEVAAGSGTITTLASFNGTNGAAPLAGVVRDNSGNLFGTTAAGGASGNGTVFEVTDIPTLAPTVTTVTAAGGTYDGTTAFAATVTVTGAGTITGSPTLDYFDNTTSTDLGSSARIHAGNYTVTATFAGDATHTGSSGTATFDVLKATSTISWPSPATIAHGTALSGTQLDATASAILNGSTVSVPGTFGYTLADGTTPALGAVLPAGPNQTLMVSFTPTDTTDFTSASGSTSLTIIQATTTLTWANPSPIVYGTALSGTQLNATASVVVNGKTVSVPGTFGYTLADGTTPALGAVLPAGPNQTLMVSFTPTDTTDFTSASGSTSLTVVQATPTLTWTKPVPITYGTPLGALQLNATANVAGSFTYTPAAGTVLHPGTQTLSVTFTPADTKNDTTATATVSLAINKATPTITWASPASIVASTPLSSTQLNATASVVVNGKTVSVPGTFSYTLADGTTPALGAVLPAGSNQTLHVSFMPTDTTDFTSASGSTSVTVEPVAPGPVVGTFSNGVNRLVAPGSWVLLTSAHATLLVVDPAGNIYAEFPGYGVEKWLSGTTWQQLTPADASVLAVGGTQAHPILVGTFNNGVNQLVAPGNWMLLTPAHASLLAVDPAGNIYADFPGYGVEKWLSGALWQQLTPADASVLATGGTVAHPILVGEFSNGVNQLVAPGSWMLLTPVQASQLAVDAAGDVFGGFGNAGVHKYSQGVTPGSGTWQSLNAPGVAASLVVEPDGTLFAELNNHGVWRYNSATLPWQLLTPCDAATLATQT